MLDETPSEIYLALGPTDMRKSINTLSILVEQAMALNPFSGDLFVFSNRARTILKILYWQTNGFCLWQKRLEKDRFQWPKTPKEILRIDHQQLRWLLSGLDFQSAHKALRYSIAA
ncbi:MAG: IS66 family insertion sequence element accessory protein TnpB [Desulfobacteraceae bacterium]|nr:IS66 family insertion sequence element accessory protein TnpB [Desulfobacteraceae bacterium]